MAKVTAKQIEEWKAKHGIVYCLETEDGLQAFIFDPTTDLRVMKMVMVAGADPLTWVDGILNNCWLGGDEEIRKNDAIKLGLTDHITEALEMPEYDLCPDGDNWKVVLEDGSSVGLRTISRADYSWAQGRNRAGKPFETAIYLLERIAIDKEEVSAVIKNGRLYVALLLAVSELKNNRTTAIKKL